MNENHNNHDLHIALNDVRALGMTDEERARIKDRILSTAPAKSGAEKISGSTAAPLVVPMKRSPLNLSILFGALIAVVLLVGAGAVSGAEGALPGNALYPMKVGFLEPLRTSFAGTGEKLAALQSSLVNTRLNEAETLATAGELNDAKREEIEQLLDRHTVALNQALDTVRTESPQRAGALTATLQASLALHARILDQFIAFASTTPATTTPASSRMHASARAAAHLKAEADMHVADPHAPWSQQLPSTTTSDFIIKNMKGSNMSAAVINGSNATTSPDKLPLEMINQRASKPDTNLIHKKTR